MTTVFIFHRDLRLADHYGLEAANALGNPVLPLFVFTPQQVTRNPLKSNNSIQFMLASLAELESEIGRDGGRMVFGYGDTEDILRALHRRMPFTAVVETRDYTPYAKTRQAAVAKACESLGATHTLVHDHYINEPGSIRTGGGKVYQKFTPFYETARGKKVEEPHGSPRGLTWARMPSGARGGGKGTRRIRKFAGQVTLEAMTRRLCPHPNEEIAVRGGRKEALELLKSLPKNYATIHDVPSEQTSMLSAHNHFGTVSIREVVSAGKKAGLTEFVRQLYWRDFYGHIMDAFEDLYGTGAYEFQKDTPAMSDRAKKAFRDWCKGTTGVPMVDAGIRQLLRTGYMHNRVRLVVASWLTKDMHVHWRLGERFFAKHLVDYDAAQNMMNWIWVASKLPFASAPFRKVDAYRTAEKFDKDGVYVKRWLGDSELGE
jgi:deoxyribodipyrimidine photo-lyase